MRGIASLMAVMAAGLVLVACGGGGETAEGDGQRVTDPALVPTSTPIQNPMVYKISGDTIQILGGPTLTTTAGTAPAGNGRKEYEVQPGDTCSAIAANLGVTLDALLKANRTIDANCANISPGQKLVVPSAATATSTTGTGTGTNRTPTPSSDAKEYTVADGDTCGGIAASLGTTIEGLRGANPSIDADCSNLQPGQTLRVP
ncbi:MAG: LysM peptidoglycan-binding domain-containing protein [Dehalococcoidia bacterium]|nr:LysM peptidoglycan-binding domain-containing protein [Dehalococcoidia bacterium]